MRKVEKRDFVFITGEAVQQSKIARKRKVYSALNPKRRRKNGVKINCGTASGEVSTALRSVLCND